MSVYRKPLPYRSPKTYRGQELAPAVPPPNSAIALLARWEAPEDDSALMDVPWSSPPIMAGDGWLLWSEAQARVADLDVRWEAPGLLGLEVNLPWDQAEPVQPAVLDLLWQSPAGVSQALALAWADAAPDRSLPPLSVPWSSPALSVSSVVIPWSTGTPRAGMLTALWRAAAARGALIALRWGDGIRRGFPIDFGWIIEPPGTPITVPIREAYLMLPNVSAVILPARTELPILAASASTDVGSWGWALSATVPLSAVPLLRPEGRATPVEIEITINGYVWTGAVTRVDDQRRFGANSARISASSRSLVLGGDYAPRRTFVQTAARNASQLADEAVAGSGWTVVWDAVDWLIPGGRYSVQDQTAIDELSRLAEVVGARIESSRTALELRVAGNFAAAAPWQYGTVTPYAILPAAILPSLSGASAGGRNADGIYVVSESFAGFVKISTTAGAEQLPVVVDTLITTADVAQERGRIELARSTVRRTEQITLPLFPGAAPPGLIPLDAVLRVDEVGVAPWLGRVASINVDGSRGEALTVRQTLGLERYYR